MKEERNKKYWMLKGDEAIQRMNKERLKIMEQLVFYIKDVCVDYLKRNSIKVNKIDVHYLYDYVCEYINLEISTMKEEKDRRIRISIGYRYNYNDVPELDDFIKFWKRYGTEYDRNPKFQGMFYIYFLIHSEIHPMDGDWFIRGLEYLYRNNKALFKRLFSGKEARFEYGALRKEDNFLSRFFFTEKEIDFVKEAMSEIIKWFLSRKEIIEVLKGEKWIEGYC